MLNRKRKLFLIYSEAYNNNKIVAYDWLRIAAKIDNSNNNRNYNRNITIGIIAALQPPSRFPGKGPFIKLNIC